MSINKVAACRLGWSLLLMIAVTPGVSAQSQSPKPAENSPNTTTKKQGLLARSVFDLLNMAGTTKASEFRPLNQSERNTLYVRSMKNPLSFARCLASAGIDHAEDKPTEWGQGAEGYGKRFANILGQYSIQRTTTYALGSWLHEDNRYFNSGKKGFWPRTGYAISSGILARHDDGTRHFSISQPVGVAAGAFLARTWLPNSENSALDGFESFGITTGGNVAFAVVKEFLPDMVRPLIKKLNGPTN
jgi:hypothetical protein